MKCDVQAGARGAPPAARVRNLLTRVARLTRAEVARATGPESARLTRGEVARATGPESARLTRGEVARATGPESARLTRGEVDRATGSGLARLTRAEVGRGTGSAGSRPEAGGAEVSVLFCGDARMRSLNSRYRRKDKSTDVLAFPSSVPGPLLGDIVVSVPYATRQARRRGEPASREIDRLLVHGFLHLLGYDHETDEGEMDELEARIRRRLSIADPA